MNREASGRDVYGEDEYESRLWGNSQQALDVFAKSQHHQWKKKMDQVPAQEQRGWPVISNYNRKLEDLAAKGMSHSISSIEWLMQLVSLKAQFFVDLNCFLLSKASEVALQWTGLSDCLAFCEQSLGLKKSEIKDINQMDQIAGLSWFSSGKEDEVNSDLLLGDDKQSFIAWLKHNDLMAGVINVFMERAEKLSAVIHHADKTLVEKIVALSFEVMASLSVMSLVLSTTLTVGVSRPLTWSASKLMDSFKDNPTVQLIRAIDACVHQVLLILTVIPIYAEKALDGVADLVTKISDVVNKIRNGLDKDFGVHAQPQAPKP